MFFVEWKLVKKNYKNKTFVKSSEKKKNVFMREAEWTNKIKFHVEVKGPQPHHSTIQSNQCVKQVESQ